MYTMHTKRPYTPVKDPIVHVTVQWIYIYGKARITLHALKVSDSRVFKFDEVGHVHIPKKKKKDHNQLSLTPSLNILNIHLWVPFKVFYVYRSIQRTRQKFVSLANVSCFCVYSIDLYKRSLSAI